MSSWIIRFHVWCILRFIVAVNIIQLFHSFFCILYIFFWICALGNPKRERIYKDDNVLSKYLKLGDPGKECIFTINNIAVSSQDPDQNILINGFFPPCSASEDKSHANRTSAEIRKIIKNNNFYWNDLFPFSPQDMKAVDQPKILNSLINNDFPEHLIEEYYQRMNKFMEREREGGNLNPLLIFVGQHANEVYIYSLPHIPLLVVF